MDETDKYLAAKSEAGFKIDLVISLTKSDA